MRTPAASAIDDQPLSSSTVTGSLYCTGNDPAPSDSGFINTVTGTAVRSDWVLCVVWRWCGVLKQALPVVGVSPADRDAERQHPSARQPDPADATGRERDLGVQPQTRRACPAG